MIYQEDLIFQTSVHLQRKFQSFQNIIISPLCKRVRLTSRHVEGLYPSIPHNAGLDALKDEIDCRQNKKIPTDMLMQIAEFVLTSIQQFRQNVFHQIFGIAIDTKFTPPYACIFMDKFEADFLKIQKLQPFVWFRYIDDEFFIWTHGKEKLETFAKELYSFSDHKKFKFESNKENINFLDVNINLSNGHLMTNINIKLTDCH